MIVRGAIDLIEAQGLAALTMRHLGRSLDVRAMSLYRYVAGRDPLLEAVVDHLIDEVRTDPDVLDTPENGWQDFLQHLAHGVRRVALRYPRTFPLVASRPPEAPWLRPPLRSLEWVEMFLDGLIGEGFSDHDAVGAYRGFCSFLLGHLLLEVSARGAEMGQPLDPGTSDDSVGAPTRNGAFSASQHPTLTRLRAVLSLDEAQAEFEESLENLLDRIAVMRVNSDRR